MKAVGECVPKLENVTGEPGTNIGHPEVVTGNAGTICSTNVRQTMAELNAALQQTQQRNFYSGFAGDRYLCPRQRNRWSERR
ncbi:hypothetical protein QM042_12515 [Escherichia coli]|uniref:hypothetical protein n=1 Tax=Escherichia coli TaxID=562 RepID=UPI0039886567